MKFPYNVSYLHHYSIVFFYIYVYTYKSTHDLFLQLDDLTWIDNEHSRNKENIYCYCGGSFTE